MPSFTESDLHFTFPEAWVVRKFDDTTAYQSLSGRGLKGVDFIAISPDRQLWLIEVKNYYPRLRKGREYRAGRYEPEELARRVAKKFSDSLRLVRIVHAHVQRHWYKRLVVWYHRHVWLNTQSNYWFWSFAHELIPSDSSGPHAGIRYVLWMETPEKNRDYDLSCQRSLTELLGKAAYVRVVELDRSHDLPFIVRRTEGQPK